MAKVAVCKPSGAVTSRDGREVVAERESLEISMGFSTRRFVLKQGDRGRLPLAQALIYALKSQPGRQSFISLNAASKLTRKKITEEIMQKIVVHRPGSHGQLRLEEHPTPRPGPGEVAIDVSAIGVNYADCVVRMGLYASAKVYVGWPITPGFEVAGTVRELGAGVSGLEVGQPVLAITRFGGYATMLVVPRYQVFPLPRGFSMAEAAAFPAVFATAWFALFQLAHPRPGSVWLVHSAAGGVGGALLQLARIHQCRAVGVVGASHKVETAQNLGAAHVIDKSRQPLWPTAEAIAPGGYDVVLDANGVATLRQSYRHLAPTGKLVVYGFHTMLPRRGGRPNWLSLAWSWLRTPRFDPLKMTTENRSVLAFNLSFLFDRIDLMAEGMGQLLHWANEGQLKPPPITEYPLSRVADAHRDLESAQTTGKLVLRP